MLLKHHMKRMLTPAEVAEREGVTKQAVTRWCRAGEIFPIEKVSGRWVISAGYICCRVVPRKEGDPPRPTMFINPFGRPKGSKNKKPYPKGVKRPRKKKLEEEDEKILQTQTAPDLRANNDCDAEQS